MIFTTKAEYGVRLLVELGRQADERAGLAEGDRRGRGPAARVPRADRRAAEEGRASSRAPAARTAATGSRGPRREITMDEAVLALEGAVAPMSCFVDDSEDGRVPVLARRGRPRRAARPSCCGRACRAASSRALQRHDAGRSSSSSARAARRTPLPRPSAQPPAALSGLTRHSPPHDETDDMATSRSRTCTSGPGTRRSSRAWTSPSTRVRSTR